VEHLPCRDHAPSAGSSALSAAHVALVVHFGLLEYNLPRRAPIETLENPR